MPEETRTNEETVADALKAAAGETEEVKEPEKKEAEEADVETEVEPEEKEEEVPDTKSREKIQARFDLLTAQKREAERRAAEAEARLREKKHSLEELYGVVSNPELAPHHEWARVEIMKLLSRQAVDEYAKTSETRMAHLESAHKAVTKFPELGKKSGLWRRANEIFIQRGYQGNPDGEYLAALEANAEASEGEIASAKTVKKSLEREQAKKGLAGSSRKPAPEPVSAKKAKLLQKAKETGNWEEYSRALVDEE